MANAQQVPLAESPPAGFAWRAARVATWLPQIAPPLAVAVFLLLARRHPYWLGAAWAAAMLLSMRGWGSVVEVLLRTRRPVDFGLSAAWGFAATLAIGGVACALHIARTPFLAAQVLVGLLLSAVLPLRFWRPALSRRRLLGVAARPASYLVVLAGLAPVLLDALGQLGSIDFNASDDPLLYIYVPEKIAQTGTPYEPYNSRRVALYGGVDYINAQFIGVCKHYGIHVVEYGVGALLLFALIVGAVAPRGLRRANAVYLALPLFLLATLGDVSVNIGSLYTSAAAFFGAYRTLLWAHDERTDGKPLPLSRIALLGACVITPSVLRPSNAMPTALFIGLALIARQLRTRLRMNWPAVWSLFRDAVYCGVGSFLFLLPWLIVFRESCGTLLYPLFKGNATPGFTLMKAEPGLIFNLRHLVGDLGYSPVDTSLLLLSAGLLPLGWGFARPKVAPDFVGLLTVLCFGFLCLTSYMFGAFEPNIDARYTYACVVGTAFAIITSIAPRRMLSKAAFASPRALLVVAAVVGHVTNRREVRKAAALARIDHFERGRTTLRQVAKADEAFTMQYRDVQAHIPEHEKVVVCVPDPFRFNLRRNPVFSLDSPGGLGPKPGFPVFKGPEVLANYFLQNGVRYLITVNYHTAIDLLNIEFWPKIIGLEHNYGAYEGPFILDSLRSLEQIAQKHRVVYEHDGLTVTDLSQPHGTP